MFANFNQFSLKLTLAEAKTGSHSGPCDDDIAFLVTVPRIKKQLDKLEPVQVQDELSEYGAWSHEELADHEENLSRILWIACSNILDEFPNS